MTYWQNINIENKLVSYYFWKHNSYSTTFLKEIREIHKTPQTIQNLQLKIQKIRNLIIIFTSIKQIQNLTK